VGELIPLAEGLPAEVRALCGAMRELFSSLDISVRRYAARRSRDAGAVSRYMNGARTPPWEFILDLLHDVSEARGSAPTPEAMAVLKDLHRKALKASNAPMHAMQLLQDQLAEADREARAATLQQQILTEALQERQRRVAELQVQLSQAEAFRSQQVREAATDIELYRTDYATLAAERDQLKATIRQLKIQLEEANRRHLESEQRCELLERQLATVEEKSATGEWRPPKRTSILIVDSRPENILALRSILDPLGQNLVTATSGEQALSTLKEAEDVSLILLSVEMKGGMDGFEIASHIKQARSTRHIPIVLLTAEKHDAHSNFRGYAAGAVDYISKPVDPWVLRAKISVFVEMYFQIRHPGA
jgi:CheY-like chemotaxis protein